MNDENDNSKPPVSTADNAAPSQPGRTEGADVPAQAGPGGGGTGIVEPAQPRPEQAPVHAPESITDQIPPAAPAAPAAAADSASEAESPHEPAPPTETAPAQPQQAEPPKPAFVKLVGVKFRRAGKDYFFNAGPLRYNIGDNVIVETERGLGLARVVTPVFEMEYEKAPADLKRVIRKANWNDLERDRKNREREDEARNLCLSLIEEKTLKMKMVRVEYLHDASKAIFYFTAETRVDFRDLVKDLARQLHTRIEMRQIGVRDEAKIVGGIGPCGRECCCATFLSDFSPVSVRMAKDQNLAMNPTKVSGLCGRLMCCLAYEHPLYHEYCKGMPKKGKRMVSPVGPCRIIDLNILGRKALVELESGKTTFIAVDDLKTQDEAQAEMDACAAMEESEGVNEEILESDDPSVLEKMEAGGGRPRPDRSRERPGGQGPDGQRAPSQERPRNQQQQNRPRPEPRRNGSGPDQNQGRQGPPRPPRGAVPYNPPNQSRPPSGATPPPNPENSGPDGAGEADQRRRSRRRRNRHKR
jgi:cell fate regulator YaaT (PSP1 superfamily)